MTLSYSANSLKHGVEYKVTSGWKTWANSESTFANGGGDGMPFQMYLYRPATSADIKRAKPPLRKPLKWEDDFGNYAKGMEFSIATTSAALILTLF